MINANIIYICTLHVLSNAEASVNFKVAAVLAVPASTYTESMICCKETLQRGSIMLLIPAMASKNYDNIYHVGQ